MKTSKQPMKSVLVVGAMVLASATMLTQSAGKAHGPKDLLHLFIREKMTSGGVIAGAGGQVDIHVNQHGKSDKQDIHIKVKNLEANTAYQLAVLLDDDTNLTQVVEFNTDKKGNASLSFRDKGKHSLPAALNPVSNIHEVRILNGAGQAVLTADLTTPDKLEYLVKRDLSTGGVKASLQIHANAHKGKLRLHASGLTPNSDYSLAMNGSVVQTETADAKGKLKIDTDLAVPVEILSLKTVALMDSAGNVMLTTTLP
jgi:hypothetical protein